jgi:hypothetical protein
MKSPGTIARWLVACVDPSVNRARTFFYEYEIPGRTINVSLLPDLTGDQKSPVFTPVKAICIPRQTMPRTPLPSALAGMKNYQECDYFCRQTYKLLSPSCFNLGILGAFLPF